MNTFIDHELFGLGSIWPLVALGLASTILYHIIFYIYNARFHPLSKFPGPKSAAISNFPIVQATIRGKLPFWTQDLHAKYGEIVRIAPDALSMIGETGWKDIYAHRQGHRPFPKYVPIEPVNGVHSIVSTPSFADHARMRRLLAHAFSDRALREQEPLIQSYINTLMQKFRELSDDKVDVVKWFNYTTFDIIAHLSFSEPFYCLQEDRYHPWIAAMSRGIMLATLMGQTRRFPAFHKLFQKLIPASVKKQRRQNFDYSVEKVTRRLEKPADPSNHDFMSYILRHNDEKGMSRAEIDGMASVLFVAGSETTATLLSGLCYNLLKNPAAMARLKDEIRGIFKTEEEMTLSAVEQLPYLMAVLQEALRIYPPAPAPFERVVPEEGDEICGQWVPGGTRVGVSNWAINHSPLHFHDPENFHPERWLDSEEADPRFSSDRRSVLNPFSVGPRSCIGRNLANAEMKLIAARLLWNFDLQLCRESEDWGQGQKVYLLWQRAALKVRLVPRTL